MNDYIRDDLVGCSCPVENCTGYRRLLYSHVVESYQNKTPIAFEGCSHEMLIDSGKMASFKKEFQASMRLWQNAPELMRAIERMEESE